jgi:hypothetical protein
VIAVHAESSWDWWNDDSEPRRPSRHARENEWERYPYPYPSLPRGSWQDEAVCSKVIGHEIEVSKGTIKGRYLGEASPEDWFPDSQDARGGLLARLVCESCPVTFECLLASLDPHHLPGIWGGLDSASRRRLIRSFQRGGTPRILEQDRVEELRQILRLRGRLGARR